MLSQSIIDKIKARSGRKNIYSGDCGPMANDIGVSETTLKRMLGLVGEDSPERRRVPHVSTMDRLAKWLGYENNRALLRDVGEENLVSEFTSVETIDVADLEEGTQIQVKYDPRRLIVMTYLGDSCFLINESKYSKLLKGDRIRISYLVLGQELLVQEVMRGDRNLGGYRGAKDGGLTSIEIIV